MTNTSSVAGDATPPPKFNKLNMQDDPLRAGIYIFLLVLAHLYVLYKTGALIILRRKLKLSGTRLKIVVGLFPMFYATQMIIRLSTRALNNDCPDMMPIAYMFRFAIHISLFCFQFRAFLVLKWFEIYGMYPQRRKRVIQRVWLALIIPGFAFCIVSWVLGIGAAREGVCTFGGTAKVLDTSVWAWAANLYEIMFLTANLATECFLRRSMISYNSKLELRWATNVSTFLLTYDVIFRFQIAASIVSTFVSSEAARVQFQSWFAYIFALIYLPGISVNLASSFERARINCMQLNPFTLRYWALLFGDARFSPEDLARHEQLKEHFKQANSHLVVIDNAVPKSFVGRLVATTPSQKNLQTEARESASSTSERRTWVQLSSGASTSEVTDTTNQV